jgi:hypothetical protein
LTRKENLAHNDRTDTNAAPLTRSGRRTGLPIPLELLSHRRRGEKRLARQPLGLIVGYRNLRWQSLHLVPAEQCFHLVLRQVLPVRIAKCDPLLPGEPDPPRRSGVKREPIPGWLATEPSRWCALFDVVLQEDRRRQLLKTVREMPLNELWRQVLGRISRGRRGVLRQLTHHNDWGLSGVFEHPRSTTPMWFPVKPSAKCIQIVRGPRHARSGASAHFIE